MPLTAGTRIGPYEVVGPLGAGGMGEVFRARDTKLNRDVALKVLPESVASDPDRLARFRREAQVLASLNHPNIAHVHGLEDSEPRVAFVMELVEGPTLAEIIEKRRGLPVAEVVPIARQLADALEAAHERGIIHRDLKPANIKVGDDGTVKVLDFGLAKAIEPDSADANRLTADGRSNSPTITTPAMTAAGLILGTAAYMAPEQAKGKPVDRRADIWAFGLVVYEMLSGRRGYQAEDVSDTLAAVLTREVDWSALPAGVPHRLLALLHDCLVRDPKQRLRDIGDARRVLDQILNGAPEPVGSPAITSSSRLGTSGMVGWSIATLALAAGAAIAFVHFREQPLTPQRVEFQIRPPEKSVITGFALSPDGRHLAFSASVPGSSLGTLAANKVWVRSVDSLDARALPGTDAATPFQDSIFWSPDSTFLGFIAEGKLKKVAIDGGPPQTVIESAPLTRATWGRDGTILLVRTPGAPLMRVSVDGGVPVEAGKAVGNESRIFQPQFLPDGRHFLYSIVGVNPEVDGNYASSLDEGAQPRRLLPDTVAAKYAPSGDVRDGGYLLFVRDTTLMAQRFDPNSLTLSGSMFPVAQSATRFSVSQNGTLAFMSTGQQSRQSLVWLDRTGKEVGVVGPPAEFRDVRLSPDETRIVFSRFGDTNNDIWVLDLARGVPSRISFDVATDNLPIWSHDARRILWPSRRSGTFDLYIKAATGAGEDRRFIAMGTVNGWASDWSRDGKFVLYQKPGEQTKQDIWVAPQATESSGDEPKSFAYLQSPFNEGNGVFSPDGRWVAYESDESGRTEVYVQAFPLTNEKDRISTGGGTDPGWSRSGSELFYLAADHNLMAVPYRADGATFEPSVAKPLFPLPAVASRRTYSVSADGRRFLVAKLLDEDTAEPVTVVLNWQAGVKK